MKDYSDMITVKAKEHSLACETDAYYKMSTRNDFKPRHESSIETTGQFAIDLGYIHNNKDTTTAGSSLQPTNRVQNRNRNFYESTHRYLATKRIKEPGEIKIRNRFEVRSQSLTADI